MTSTRPGRPVRGSALWWTRRVVLVARLVLVVVAVVSGVIAAGTEQTDIALSNALTVVMLASVVAILLGGLLWWVEPSTPPAVRARERLRTVGRWTRAVLAAGGVALFSYWIVTDEEDLAQLALLVVAVSPLPYLVLTAIGKTVTQPVWEQPADEATQPAWRRRRHERLRAAVAATRETLVEPGTPRGPLTIRPRRPQPGSPAPAELATWLRDAAMSTDGTALTVTGRGGTTYRIPLAAGPDAYGAAELLVVRETVETTTRYGRSAPRSRELLCVLDPAGRRLVDIDLYGWTRSDLVALARATGMRLDRYAPRERQHSVPNLRGRAPTAFEQAVPRAATHRTLRGRSPWRDVPPVLAIVVATVAGYFGVVYAVDALRSGLTLPQPWQTITTGAVGVAMISVLVAVLRGVGVRYQRRRQAARAGLADAP